MKIKHPLTVKKTNIKRLERLSSLGNYSEAEHFSALHHSENADFQSLGC